MSIVNIATVMELSEGAIPEFPLDYLSPSKQKERLVGYIDLDGKAKTVSPNQDYFTVPLLEIEDIEKSLLELIFLIVKEQKSFSINSNKIEISIDNSNNSVIILKKGNKTGIVILDASKVIA